MDVFIANKGKKHGKLVRRNYPKSKRTTISQLLGKRRKNKGAKRRKNVWFKSAPKKTRKAKKTFKGGIMAKAKTRRAKRRKNVWYNDHPGHVKAGRKGAARKRRKSAKKSRTMKAYWRKVKAGAVRRKRSRKGHRARKVSRGKSSKRARAARKGWAKRKRHVGRGKSKRRHYRTITREAVRRAGGGRALYDVTPGGSRYITNPRKRRKSRRGRRHNPGRKVSRRVSRRNPALPIVGSLPVVGEYFNMATVKMVGGVGAGFIASGILGDKLAAILMEKVTFLAAYPVIVRPLSMLIVGGGATLVLGKMLKMPTLAKYIFLGAGVAAAVDVLSNVYVKITGGLTGNGTEDYIQYGDQGQVERGMLGDYVQLAGMGGMPGLGSQAAVEAGLLNDFVQM